MNKQINAIVIGGSLGGLMAALYLKKCGVSVDVFERSDAILSGRGAGIVSQPELEGVLSDLGIYDANAISFTTTDRKFLTSERRERIEIQRVQRHFSWTKLYSELLELLGSEHYHLGFNLSDAVQDENRGLVRFSNGTEREADLIVGADGIGSRIRHIFAPHVVAEYAGYVGWRGIVDVTKVAPDVNEVLGSSFVMATPERGQFVCYPVIAEQRGKDRKCYNFVWYRPAPAETVLRDLLTDEAGVEHTLGIPPPLIRDTVIQDIRREAERILPEPLAKVIALTDRPFLQPIYDLVSDRMTFGRCVTLGDAAFVARPHVGAGVTKAALDARCLATAVGSMNSLDSALQSYQNDRFRAGEELIARARYLGRPLTCGDDIGPLEMLEKTAWLADMELS